jgi:hypothetical protein
VVEFIDAMIGGNYLLHAAGALRCGAGVWLSRCLLVIVLSIHSLPRHRLLEAGVLWSAAF